MSRRGQSCGGGYSSLGYLFGNDEPPRLRPNNRAPQPVHPAPERDVAVGYDRKELGIYPQNERPPAGKVFEDERYMDTSEGRMGRTNNNYHRADGQNCGNFITDRPSTRVQSSPGGQSSLGYLFG